jgi:hypothetical protein
MIEGPDRLLGRTDVSHELDVLVVDDIKVCQTLLIKTNGSMFIFEPTSRTDHGGLRGNVTRFAEAPMTTERGTTYLPDVLIVKEDCLLFDGSILSVDEPMYFHDIHYAGRTYTDGDYDVIHTAPVEAFMLLDSDVVASN